MELTKRERQVMDALYRDDGLTAAEIRAGLPSAPSNSAVRALLSTMEDKALIRHVADGPRYRYFPVVPRDEAGRSALQRVVRAFFGDDPRRAALALLQEDETIPDSEVERLQALIDESDP
ncbi:MAG: BlaI/MecI/CopY family transcriptional regulator [Myxococcota bacterium]